MKILRFAFVGAAIVWAVALPLAPLAVSRPHAASAWYAFAFVAYAVGGLICHQRPERSLHLWAAQFPVCARCTGIYVGAAIAAAATAWRRTKALRHDSAYLTQGFSPAKIALLISIMPTMATLAYEWSTGHTPSNWIRAAAGIPPGAALAWIIGGPTGKGR